MREKRENAREWWEKNCCWGKRREENGAASRRREQLTGVTAGWWVWEGGRGARTGIKSGHSGPGTSDTGASPIPEPTTPFRTRSPFILVALSVAAIRSHTHTRKSSPTYFVRSLLRKKFFFDNLRLPIFYIIIIYPVMWTCFSIYPWLGFFRVPFTSIDKYLSKGYVEGKNISKSP